MRQFGANFLIQRGRISSLGAEKANRERDRRQNGPISAIRRAGGTQTQAAAGSHTAPDAQVPKSGCDECLMRSEHTIGRCFFFCWPCRIKIRVLTFPHEWGLIRLALAPRTLLSLPALASFPFQNWEEAGGGTTAAASCWQASQGFYEIFIEPCNHDIAVFLISSLIPAPNAAARALFSHSLGQQGWPLFLWCSFASRASTPVFVPAVFIISIGDALYILGRAGDTFSFVSRGAKIRLLSSSGTRRRERSNGC